MDKNKKIVFLKSFKADISIVTEIIDMLLNDLRSMGFPREEIDEIVLAMDEAVTNAVQITICYNRIHDRGHQNHNVTVRYHITEEEFEATIIDHGSGLDFIEIAKGLPNTAFSDYHEQIISYATEKKKPDFFIKVNQKEISLKGIGAGLKIILQFMDSVEIDYMDKNYILASNMSDSTDGTILSMKRKRRYH